MEYEYEDVGLSPLNLAESSLSFTIAEWAARSERKGRKCSDFQEDAVGDESIGRGFQISQATIECESSHLDINIVTFDRSPI